MSLSNLNFEVILNDKDFNTKVKADIELAEKLNTQLSRLLTAQSKLGGAKTLISAKGVENAEKMSALLTEISGKMGSLPNNVKLVDATIKRTTTNVTSMNTSLSGTAGILRTISQLTGTAFSIIGLRRLISDLVEVTGNLELQKESMTHILGSAEKGTVIFEQLKELAKPSYFTLPDLTKYAKQLAALSIPYEELFETTKMLGDVSAGLGVSFDRIALAYGHIRSMGFLRGMQARQLTNAGIPIFEELAKNLSEVEKKSVSISDVYDRMAKRMITFEQVKEVFVQMTSEGGKFYDMQIAMTDTLAGRVNKLKGVWEIALSELGNEKSGLLKGTINGMIAIVQHLTTIGNVLTPLIAAVGAYGAAMLLAFSYAKIAGIIKMAGEFIVMARNVGVATASVVAFGSATKAVAAGVGALALVGVAIYEIAKAANKSEREMAAFKKNLEDIHKSARDNASYDKEISKIDTLRKTINNANLSYSAREQALKQLKSIVADYHADLTTEGVLINNNTDALDRYISKLNEQAKMKGAEDELVELYKARREQKRAVDDAEKAYDKVKGNSAYYDKPILDVYGWIFGTELENKKRDFDDEKKKLAEIDKQIADINAEIAASMDSGKGNGLVTDINSIVASIKSLNNEITALEKKAKLAKEAGGGLNDEEEERLKTLRAELKTEKERYELYAGKKYDKELKDQDSARKDEVRSIDRELAILERYKRAYDEFEPRFGEETGKFLAPFFPGTTEATFNEISQTISDLIEKLRTLGKEGEEAADKIETRLGMDALSVWKKADAQAEKSKKALEDYQKYYRKWFGEDFNLGGTGAEFDLRKILSDYESNVSKVREKYNEGVEKAKEAHKGNADAIKAEVSELRRLANAEVKYYNAQKDEKIRDLAKTIFNEQMSGYDLSDWGDKTLAQIYDIRKALLDLKLPKWIKDLLDDEQLAELEKILKEMGQKKVDNTLDPELGKKYAGYASKTATYLKRAASSMKELAEATNDAHLANTASAVGALADNLSAAAEGYQATGSWIGAVAGGLLNIVEQGISLTAQQEQRMRELREAIQSVRLEYEKTKFSESINTHSIFGENPLGDAAKAINSLDELKKKLQEVEYERKKLILRRYAGLDLDGRRGDSRVGHSPYSRATWEAGYEDVANYAVRATAPNWWQEYIEGSAGTFKTIGQFAEELKMDLYDEFGNLNPELLKAIVNMADLYEADKEWMENAITYAEEYQEAMKKIDEVVESIMGNIVSDVADKIVDSWWEAGNAALDYADILEDVAKSYAKLMVQQILFDEAFDKDTQDALKQAFRTGDATEAMNIVSQAMDRAVAMLPVAEAALEAFEPYRGIGSDQNGSLGDGIKGITEETASILASYINAIRADVSVIRGILEQGKNTEMPINEIAPTLADYMQQVAANTYDTAQNTNRILTELQSVIGAPGTNGMVVRVEQV